MEDTEALRVVVDLPGVSGDNIDVRFDDKVESLGAHPDDSSVDAVRVVLTAIEMEVSEVKLPCTPSAGLASEHRLRAYRCPRG